MNQIQQIKIGADVGDAEFTAYCSRVIRCANSHLDMDISNGLPRHAEFLMRWLISSANRVVRLYTGGLTERTSDGTSVYSSSELIASVVKLLGNADSRLTIVTQRAADFSNHALVTAVRKAKHEGVIFGQLSLRQLSESSLVSYRKHFLVTDNGGFRIETDHERTTAVANFNDVEVCRVLAERFDQALLPNSTSLLAL